jgi:predicted RND superfamily exporter protein
MALMTAVTIFFAIIADFLLLPPLLMAIDAKEENNA